MQHKFQSIALLLVAEMAAMSLWFVSAAILPDILREFKLPAVQQAALSSGVQAGFVIGALISAVLGIADRFDPRRVFAVSAISAGLVNAILLAIDPGSVLAVAARVVTGAFLAGVYPVGMKIAVGWGLADRGFLVGLLVGALTLGSASPHLVALAGGANWRVTVAIASTASIAAGLLGLATKIGPYHTSAATFDPRLVVTAWTNKKVRLAYAGYLGHMWELYAMWAWIAVAAAASFRASMPSAAAEHVARLTAFSAIAAGGIACGFAGFAADRIGKANVTIIAMLISGGAALATALTFGGPAWLTITLIVIWGIAIVPDSAQFSALVADHAPPGQAGSLMTLQTALGFALTIATVQLTAVLASHFGWPVVLSGLAIGPALGVLAMTKLRSMP
ncbi:MAG: MFS transporter [Hyphomicrobiaceae bacterium]